MHCAYRWTAILAGDGALIHGSLQEEVWALNIPRIYNTTYYRSALQITKIVKEGTLER